MGGNHRQREGGTIDGEGVTIDGEGVTADRGRGGTEGGKGNKWFTYLCRPAVRDKGLMRKLMSDVYYLFALNKGMSFCTRPM